MANGSAKFKLEIPKLNASLRLVTRKSEYLKYPSNAKLPMIPPIKKHFLLIREENLSNINHLPIEKLKNMEEIKIGRYAIFHHA